MSDGTDVRWRQRFNNFKKALAQLNEAVELTRQRKLSNLEEQGLIQAYEFTYELAWNVIKDYLSYQGFTNVVGSRDAFREAFQRGMITDGESWMRMVRDRNLTAHTYDDAVAHEVSRSIVNDYFPLFMVLRETMDAYGKT